MLEELKRELERAYRVLSADNADMQNSRDIWVWERKCYIIAEREAEHKELAARRKGRRELGKVESI